MLTYSACQPSSRGAYEGGGMCLSCQLVVTCGLQVSLPCISNHCVVQLCIVQHCIVKHVTVPLCIMKNCAACVLSRGNPPGMIQFHAFTAHATTQVNSLTIHIYAQRLAAPYIISAVVPVVATTWLAFGAFFLPRKNLEARLGECVVLGVTSHMPCGWL
jgi:hypothetical protein